MLRHLLEVIYECVVDSGLPLSELQQTKTGIYLACFGSDTDFTETSRELTANGNNSLSEFLLGLKSYWLLFQKNDHINPLPHMSILASSNSAANKDMML